MSYIIVGAEVGEKGNHIAPDGTISDKPSDGSRPLDVEYIGALMVHLSRLGRAGVSDGQLRAHENAVKHALQVLDGGKEGAAVLSDATKAEILANTTVQIMFESRTTTAAGTDENTRILVVPADKTLEVKADDLADDAQAPGFKPALVYELDEMLLLASKEAELMDAVRSFATTGAPGWTPGLQAALEKHVGDALRPMTKFAGGTPAGAKADILSQPLKAFHRSVGIYATNMCR